MESGGSVQPQKLQFTHEQIQNSWDELKIHTFVKTNWDFTESDDTLRERCENQLTNFTNIGGNSKTRPCVDDFVDANYIEENVIATGYPTEGKMRTNYWGMIASLRRKGKSPFIVNLMHERDIGEYGGWFFPEGDSLAAQSTPANHGLSFVAKENKNGWEKYTHKINDTPFSLFHYPYWEDFSAGDQNQVIDLVKELYHSMQGATNPTVVINCRAGIGRTGTFATIFHFYSLLEKQGKDLRTDDFSLNAIQDKVLTYRIARGDGGFVQEFTQFEMVCLAIQQLYNEKLSFDG